MLLLVLLSALASAADRVAVVVGANQAPPGRTTLRYGHADARQVARTLVDVAGFAPEHVVILKDPEPEVVLGRLRELTERPELLVFYYSGHGDERALYPGGKRLELQALKAALYDVDAGFRLGVVDACRGVGWTGAKGLTEIAPFPVGGEQSLGTALIAASSGSEDAHEAEAIGGSFFTHHWTTGLRGPADRDGDGEVTLSESFAYARARTVHDSTVHAGTAQHPSFHYDLRGRDELVLADLRGAKATVSLRWDRGEVSVHALDTGTHVADLPRRREGYRLALPPAPYLLRRRVDGEVQIAHLEVKVGAEQHITEGDFQPAGDVGRLARKGDVQRGAVQMAPHKGQWAVQMAVGHQMLNSRDVAGQMHGVVSVGLTERLTLNPVVPGLSWRLGERGQREVLVHLGAYEGGYGVGWGAGAGAFFDAAATLGVGVDLRQPVSDAWTAHGSVRLAGPLGYGGGGAPERPTGWWRGPLETEVAGGVALHLGQNATLYPALGLQQMVTGSSRTAVVWGSALRQGVRRMPLAQLHLTNGVSLDAYFTGGQLRERHATGASGSGYWETMLGATFTSRRRQR